MFPEPGAGLGFSLLLGPDWLCPDWPGAGGCGDSAEGDTDGGKRLPTPVAGEELKACGDPGAPCPAPLVPAGAQIHLPLPACCSRCCSSPARGGPWTDGRSLISPPTCSVLHLFPAPSAPLPPDSLTLRLLQTIVFHNASSSHVEGVALLADLETHSMNCSTCPIRFLQPWARQGLTPKQWQELEQVIHRYLFNFIRLVNRLAQQQGQSYPIVIQSAFGCELHPNGTSRGFYEAGVSGQDFLGFDMDAGTWVARSEDKAALYTRDRLNQDKGTISTIRTLLGTTCVSEIKSFVSHGNASLQRAAGRRSVCPGASPSRAPHAVAAGLLGHRVLPPGRPRGLAAGRGGGGAGLAAELQRDPAQRRPDLPAAQLPGRGAGRRAQLRLPGAAQQPGGPEPADPLGAQQAPGPWPGRGHHPGGSGRGRGCGRGAVAVQTQGLPGCWSQAVQGLRADPGQAWGPAPLPGHGVRGWLQGRGVHRLVG
ncbi:uncharacterized protein LOC142823560 isoform X1 [Pelodiscus sinensis]|uniref:uncharacterized protein LOC142823560 isoform X1 n=1 Tax=Pelodiscus sinensis TaxID=13735 RepID=UPI003F6D6E4E